MKKYDFITGVNHIGVATRDYKATATFYEAVGYHEVVGGYDPIQNVYGYFYEADGVTPYHLCYNINCSMEEAVKELRGDRFMVVSKPSHSDNLKGRVCFLFHKDVGIVELFEHE